MQVAAPVHTIVVRVHKDRLKVSVPELHMCDDEQVQWVSRGGNDFEIDFGGQCPLEPECVLRSANGQTRVVKPRPGEHQKFKYTVRAAGYPDLDPTVVIDEPPPP